MESGNRRLDLSAAAQLSGNTLGGSYAQGRLDLDHVLLVLRLRNAVPLRSNASRVGCRLVVLSVVPFSAFSTLAQTSAGCGGCGSVNVVRPSAVARIVAARVPHATPRRSLGAPAQQALAADRFAREIGAILETDFGLSAILIYRCGS